MLLAQIPAPLEYLGNPIGFGPADFVELVWAALLAGMALVLRPWVEPLGQRLAARTGWSMLALAMLPVGLRLALLPNHPLPEPVLYDEFSHLLVADTLRHFRLANPMHSLHQFFETFFVLQEPTYSSIYPVGQGLALAIGRAIFGNHWAGVAIPMGMFCALCYWMLRGWVTPGWALVGGLLATFEFGPLNQWMNSYWGGGLPAAAGCLVFGALPRLRERGRARDGVLAGMGIAIHTVTRQYESIFLVLTAVAFFLPLARKPGELRRLAGPVLCASLAVLPAIAITLCQNKQVTGSWLTLPEALSQYQYGVPAALTFQTKPTPHLTLTPEQQLDYKMQRSFLAGDKDTIGSYLSRLGYRIRFYRFFFYVPLYLALPFFLLSIREWRFCWAALTLCIFALGINFFPAFQFHYIAACTCLFVLASVAGLERLSRLRIRGEPAGVDAVWVILLLCAAHFLFWYGLHVLENWPPPAALLQYETWDSINHGDPQGRKAVNGKLAEVQGKQLVFVRYWPQHIFQQEWVYNDADIDRARVVWARDLGPVENQKLLRNYPDRKAWLLEPDARPPKLSTYQAEAAPAEVPKQPQSPRTTKQPNQQPFLLPVPPAPQ